MPEGKEKTIEEKIITERDYFQKSSQDKRQKWLDIYKHYMSYLDESENNFMSNLFVPKTHEAVELLTAFLAGANQTIEVEPEGKNDTKKAAGMEKLLQFQWRKVINAQDKIVNWVKQAILFGNGIIKVGWETTDEKDVPFMEVVNLPDVYFDFYIRNIQDSSVIHRILKPLNKIKENPQYKKSVRENVIAITDEKEEEEKSKFGAYDSASSSQSKEVKKGEILEYWTQDNEKVITIGNTEDGWQKLKEIDNPYKDVDGKKYKPFVKVRFKASPLPNRAYDIGSVEPTLRLQQAYNDMLNEIFDNVTLINNKQWIIRRGAQLNPGDLVRRPGGAITVDDINADIKGEQISDIKQSALEVLNILDNEFQQASAVVNLLKGITEADTATEATLGQQNVQTLLELVNQNIREGMSELGQMLANLNIDNLQDNLTIKLFENDNEIKFLDIDPKKIKGKYDVKIAADRASSTSKAVKQKQLLDLLSIISADQTVAAQYPDARIKIYKKWMEEAGFSDPNYYFEKTNKNAIVAGGGGTGVNTRQRLTAQNVEKRANAPLKQGL